jgi:hypothetical protein
MKQPDCPRCLEPFERGDRFCKKCGLRKSRPFSPMRWWSFALLADLLIVLFFAILREKILSAANQPLDLATESAWLIFGVLGLCLLIPTICLYQVSRVLWLLKHGMITSGKVVKHRLLAAPKGRTRQVAIVKFTADIAQPTSYEVQHWAMIGILPLKQKVQVRYDPYNPGGCAQVGLGMSDLIFYALLSLMFLGLAAFIAVAVLMVAPS